MCWSAEAGSLSHDAVTYANVANVAIGVSILAIGVGAYLFFTERAR